MDFGKSFSFPFEDRDWLKKLGIAALILLIPFLGAFVVVGYAAEITKRTIRRNPVLLPEWDDFDAIMGYLVVGFKVAVIGFVYSLPIILIQACSQTALIMGQDSYEDVVTILVTISAVCFGCLTFLYSLLMGMLLPAAISNFVETEELKAAFSFREVFGLVRAAPGAFALVLLVSFLAGIIGSLGTIACVIGVVFTTAYAAVIYAHMQGQAYLIAKGSGFSSGGDNNFEPELDPGYDPDATTIFDPDSDDVVHISEV